MRSVLPSAARRPHADVNPMPQTSKKARARALIQGRRFEEARSLCASLARTSGNDGELWLLSAIAHAELGKTADAVAACERAMALQPELLEARLLLGRLHARAGNPAAAIAEWERVVEINGRNGTAIGLLANLLLETGRVEEAILMANRYAALSKEVPAAHNTLGRALREQGRLEEAEEAYRRAITLRPSYAVAWHNLGDVMLEQGNARDAIAAFEKSLSLSPPRAITFLRCGDARLAAGADDEAWQDYGKALHLSPTILPELTRRGDGLLARREWEAADIFFERLSALAPADLDVLLHRGQALFKRGRHEEAIGLFERVIEMAPDSAEAYNDLGVALLARKQVGEAISRLGTALRLRPEYAEAHNNLCTAYMEKEEWDKAIASCTHALAIRSDFADALGNMGSIHSLQRRFSEAVPWFQRALALAPRSAEIHNSYGIVLQQLGDSSGAVEHFREVIRNDSRNPDGPQNITFMVNYLDDLSPEEVFSQHRQWARRYESGTARARRYSNIRNPEKKLRIGYVSPDLRGHPVASFFEPLLASHDRAAVEIYCYSDAKKPDAVTERLRGYDTHWRETRLLSNADFDDLVVSDSIDILVDLAGHTDNNRLQAFARRPAPVQVTYLGYCNTTGLHEMDYRLTDEWADPPGTTEQWHTEKLVRLRGGFLCYQPEKNSPPVGPLPALGNGHVTFGSFNNIMKISPSAIRAWSALLNAVPGSRLLLKSRLIAEPVARERLVGAFVGAGVSPDRLELSGFLAKLDHLDAYNRVDIALDPFPYNGTTTTCESLWMGVPVMVLGGEVHAGRVGVSLMSSLHLTDLIAANEQDYVDRCVRLASDMEALANLRRTLRERMSDSPLCAGARLSGAIEAAYRQMWRQWCGENPA